MRIVKSYSKWFVMVGQKIIFTGASMKECQNYINNFKMELAP